MQINSVEYYCTYEWGEALTLSLPHKLLSAKFPRLLQFSNCFNVAQSWRKCCLSVEQLGSRWDAELLGVSSGSKLLAYGTIIDFGGLKLLQCIGGSRYDWGRSRRERACPLKFTGSLLMHVCTCMPPPHLKSTDHGWYLYALSLPGGV